MISERTDRLAKGLGWFSVGLGLLELLAPETVGRASGLEHRPGLVRAYGFRELAAGLGILMGGSLAFWLWARVAGDAVDLATLAEPARYPGLRRKAVGAAAAVAGVTALDVLCASRSR